MKVDDKPKKKGDESLSEENEESESSGSLDSLQFEEL